MSTRENIRLIARTPFIIKMDSSIGCKDVARFISSVSSMFSKEGTLYKLLKNTCIE